MVQADMSLNYLVMICIVQLIGCCCIRGQWAAGQHSNKYWCITVSSMQRFHFASGFNI